MTLIHLIRSLFEGTTAVKTGRYLYHTADPKVRKTIDTYGIQPKFSMKWVSGSEVKGAVLAINPEGRVDHTGSEGDVWRIDTYVCPEVGWRLDPNFDHNEFKHMYTQQSIPRKTLKLVHECIGTFKS